MSWIDKLQDTLTITTGDGKVYTPLWMNASKAFEFNVSQFDFPEIPGELIRRKKVKARRFPLELYFQGDDHLDISSAFEVSSYDERAWIIAHPYYGNITVQPMAIDMDNSKQNLTKISVTVIETITEDSPKVTIDPADNISIQKENLDTVYLAGFDVTPASADINTLTASNESSYKKGSKILKLKDQAEDYFNLFNKAQSGVSNATSAPLAAMRATQSFINAPALFTASVKNRMNVLTDQFNTLRLTVSTLTGRSSKKVYEQNAGYLISAQALAASKPDTGDYKNKTDVIDTVDFLINNYNNYLLDLDNLQTANGGSPDSYIPDANSLIGMSQLINATVSSLFQIALGSRSERSVILEEDTNWILLTHRFYGLDPLDENIVEMMSNNNSGLNDILQLKKGRKITYYV